MSANSRSTSANGVDKSILFVKDGSPMVFHLPPGVTKKKLASVVNFYGGELTSKRQQNVICLADEKMSKSYTLQRKTDCYWPTYITDCVKENKLLDIEPYQCSKGTRLMRAIPESVNGDSTMEAGAGDREDEDDMAPSKTLIRVPVSSRGRQKYTKAEDINILKYLMETGEYSKAKGIAVWRNMEKFEVTTHPAQSMMTRFRDIIIKQLDDYNIPDNWKSCLSGNTDRARPKAVKRSNDNETDGHDDANHTMADNSVTNSANEQIDDYKVAAQPIQDNTEKDKREVQPVTTTTEPPELETQPFQVQSEDSNNTATISDEEDDFDKQLLQMISTPPERQNDADVQEREQVVAADQTPKEKPLEEDNSESLTSLPADQTPRKRGRPPKEKPLEEDNSESPTSLPADQTPRKRGRPPKEKPLEEDDSESLTSFPADQTPRKRGRPPKEKPLEEDDSESLTSLPADQTPRKRGRPPKEKPLEEDDSESLTSLPSDQTPRKRGRPPKQKTQLEIEDSESLTSPTAATDLTPRKRGRPPKQKTQLEVEDSEWLPFPTAAAILSPKQGRPPKQKTQLEVEDSEWLPSLPAVGSSPCKRGRPQKKCEREDSDSLTSPSPAGESTQRKRGRPRKKETENSESTLDISEYTSGEEMSQDLLSASQPRKKVPRHSQASRERSEYGEKSLGRTREDENKKCHTQSPSSRGNSGSRSLPENLTSVSVHLTRMGGSSKELRTRSKGPSERHSSRSDSRGNRAANSSPSPRQRNTSTRKSKSASPLRPSKQKTKRSHSNSPQQHNNQKSGTSKDSDKANFMLAGLSLVESDSPMLSPKNKKRRYRTRVQLNSDSAVASTSNTRQVNARDGQRTGGRSPSKSPVKEKSRKDGTGGKSLLKSYVKEKFRKDESDGSSPSKSPVKEKRGKGGCGVAAASSSNRSLSNEEYHTADSQGSGTSARANSRSRLPVPHHTMQAFICHSDDEEAEEQHTSRKNPKRLTALGVLRALSAEFDLTHGDVAAILKRHNGHVKAARYWILTGNQLPGHHCWTREEDRVLLKRSPDHPHWQKLEERCGLTAVLTRIHWLQGKD
ncbi:telomeric repeat-binding factor 2-interacting protein 1-like [Littorina saxatilis]|uniref:telomeric repeat-binding factor 2-interacting protein 1-like n=1 Tax=Littorina saxatilis TaxID=31220 RepID=UPI0038B6AC46